MSKNIDEANEPEILTAENSPLLNGLVKVIYPIVAGLWLTMFAGLFGLISCITVIGIPFGCAWFKLAYFAFWPFNKKAVKLEEISGIAKFGNIMWLLVNLLPLVVLFLLFWAAMAWTPGDRQLDKVFAYAFWPFGKKVVKE